MSLVVLLAFGHGMAFIDRNLSGVIAPLLKLDMALSDARLGFLDGPAFALPYVVGMFASLPLTNSRYRFRLLAGCVAIWALGMLAFALGQSFGVLVMARAVVGFGQSAFVPLALSLIVERSAAQWRARSIALFTAAAVIGRGLAALLGGAALTLLSRWESLSYLAHWRLLLLVMAAPNLVLILLLLHRDEPSPASSPSRPRISRSLLSALRQRPVLMFAYVLSASASVLIIQTIGAWAPSVLHREQGLVPGTAALVFGSSLLAASPLGHMLAGTLVDMRIRKLSPMAIVAVALLLTVPLLWELPRAQSPAVACGLFALTSLVGGTAAVAALAGVPWLLPAPLRDLGLRLFLAIITLLGFSLGPLMAGVVSDGLGLGGHRLSLALYQVCVTVALAGTAAALMANLLWQRGWAAIAR